MRVETSITKVLGTVLFGSLFLVLGFWQLDRAEQKRQMQERAEARTTLPPVEINSTPLDRTQMEYRSAVATGSYLEPYQTLVDNKVYRGRAGFHVLTPLVLAGSEVAILVNRGWAPWGADRQSIPRIAVEQGVQEVRGRLIRPSQHAISFEAYGVPADQAVWQNIDLVRFQQWSGLTVHGLILRLSPDQPDPAALIRDWPVYTDLWIERHRAYAFQWFAMAFVLVCIFLAFSVKRR